MQTEETVTITANPIRKKRGRPVVKQTCPSIDSTAMLAAIQGIACVVLSTEDKKNLINAILGSIH